MLRLALALILAAQSWLVISDIHFDPFTKPALTEKLAATPPQRWRAVFATQEERAPSTAGADTNEALLELALEGARANVPDPRVVIIAGDWLAPDFRAKFERTARSHDEAAYRAFVDKTMAFLAWELQTAFPRARFLPVVGNDDGYCGDYESTPHDAFLARFGADWASSVGPGDPNAFIAQFSTGGYYVAPLPTANGAQAIVLNDVLWSAQYRNACGDRKADPGGDELQWLQRALAGIAPGAPVWVIAHVPPGIDVSATLRAKNGQIVTYLADRFNGAFVNAISALPAAMAIAGHAHAEGFRVIGPDPSTPRVPLLVAPAISPASGEPPGFVALTVDENTASVLDEQLYDFVKGRDGYGWRRVSDFSKAHGAGAIDALKLWNVQQTLFRTEAPSSDATWRSAWCASVALTAIDYLACAMPQIQRDLQPHPPAPPAPTPGPSSSPVPSASPDR